MKKLKYILILIFCIFYINVSFANLLNVDYEYDNKVSYVSNNDIHERKFVDEKGKEILNVNGIYSKLNKIYDISTNELKYLLRADRHIYLETSVMEHTHYKHVNDTLYSITGQKINNILKVDTTYNVNDNEKMKYIGVWNDYIIYYVFGYGPDDTLDLLKQFVEYDKIDDDDDDNYFRHGFLVLYDIKNNKNITVSHYEEGSYDGGSYDVLPLNDKLFVYTVCSPYQNLLKVKMVDKNAQILKTAYYDIEDRNDKINDNIKLKIAYRMLMDDFVSNNELVKYDIDDIVNADIEKVKLNNGPLDTDKIYIINKLKICDAMNSRTEKVYKYYELSGSDYDAKRWFGKEINGKYYRLVDDKMYIFDCEEYNGDKELSEYNFTIYDEFGKEIVNNIKLCYDATIIHYGIDPTENNTPLYYHTTSKDMIEKWYKSYLLPALVDTNYYKLKKNGKYSLVSIDGKVLFDDIDNFALDEYQYGIRRYIVEKDGHWIFLDENGNILTKDFDVNYDFNKIIKVGDDTFVLFYKDYHYDSDNSYFDSSVIDIYGKDGLVKKNLKQCDVVGDKYFNVVTPLHYGLIDKTGNWFCKFSAFDNLVYD